MRKFIFYLGVPFQDIPVLIVLLVLTAKLIFFTYSNDLEIISCFPAVGVVLLGLGLSLFINRRLLKITYLIVFDLLCSLILFSNALYLKYFDDYATLNNFDQIRQLPFVADMIIKMAHTELLYIADILCAPLLFIAMKENRTFSIDIKRRAFVILLILGLYFNSRSLIFLISENDAESLVYRRYNVTRMGIINYQIIDAYFYFTKEIRKNRRTKEDETIVNAWLDSRKHEREPANYLTGTGKGMNLVIIQVESMQGFVINRKYHGKEITPNLNALARKGIYFNNIYDQTGYGNSSDATLLANASLYPSRRGAACFLYGQNSFDSLPKVLNNMGYSTAAMHANIRQFWNSEVFEKSLGFNKRFYKDDYILVDPLGWGLSDKFFFSQSLAKIKLLHPPFYAFLRTLSTHDPFDHITKDIDSFPLYELEGETIGSYIRAMHYADATVGSFIRQLSENNIKGDTVIVVYGDHRARLADNDLGKMGISDISESKKIPLLIYIPNKRQGGQRNIIGGLIDVAPTICNIMGIDITGRYFLGKDLADRRNSFVIFRNGSFISSNGVLNKSAVQRMLEVSDIILEKDIIPVIKNIRACNGISSHASNGKRAL